MKGNFQPSDDLLGAKKFLSFLDMIPNHYKVGPWSPVVYLVLCSFASFLLLTFNDAFVSYDSLNLHFSSSSSLLQTFRLIAGLYCLSITIVSYIKMGIWPFFSYTLTSWNLLAVRLITAFLAGVGVPFASTVATIVRLPALIGCTITVTVWWGILTPLICHLIRKDKKQKEFFWAFNLSFALVNVHFLNLPIVVLEFLLSRQTLTFFDLWVSLLTALLYCLVYLNILDANGLHFYIIFTPRTHYCFIPYGLILASYYGLYLLANHLLKFFNTWHANSTYSAFL